MILGYPVHNIRVMDHKKKHNLAILQDRLWQEASKGSLRCLLCHTVGPAPLSTPSDISPLWRSEEDYVDQILPYEPFFTWIRKAFEYKSINECAQIMDELYLSEDHKEILLNHIMGTELVRIEAILLEESEYQRHILYDNIWTLLIYAVGIKHQAFSLHNLQSLPLSTLHFLIYILKNKRDYPFFFLLYSDMNNIDLTEHHKKLIEKITSLLEEKDYILHIKTTSILSTAKKGTTGTVKNYLASGKNSLALLAWEDSIYWYTALKDILETERVLNKSYYWKETMIGLGIAYLYLGDYNSSFHYIQHLHNILSNSKDAAERAMLYQLLGTCSHHQEKWIQAEQMLRLAYESALKSQDNKTIFLIHYSFLILENDHPFLEKKEWQESLDNVLNNAINLGYHNSYIKIMMQHYRYDLAGYEARIKSAIKLAKIRKNYYRLTMAYHNFARAYEQKGKAKKVLKYYAFSLDMVSRHNIPSAMPIVNNSYGYYYLNHGQFKQSINLFMETLESLKEGELFPEIGLTLLNIGQNYLLAGYPQKGAEYFEYTLAIMESFGMLSIKNHSKAGIQILLALCYLKTNQKTRAWQLFLETQNHHWHPAWGDQEGYFINLLVHALFEWEDGNEEEARYAMKKAQSYLEEHTRIAPCLRPYFYLEYGHFNRQFKGHKGEAQRAYGQGYEICKLTGNNYYKEIFENQIRGRYAITPAYQLLGKDMSWLQKKIEKGKNATTLQRRTQEINFLTLLSDIVERQSTPQKIIHQALETLYSNFPFTAVYYHERRGENYQLVHQYSSLFNVDIYKLSHFIDDLINKDHPVFSTHMMPQHWKSLYPSDYGIISLPILFYQEIHSHILCLVPLQYYPLPKEELKILSIGTQMINQALEKVYYKNKVFELQSRFERHSKADLLTHKGNYYTLIDDLEAEIARESRQNPDMRHTFSLMAIDLDRFEYFNETFGHHVGDNLLIEFSGLLEDTVREMDKIYRLQGDEFILLIPDTYKETAQTIAHRIQRKLMRKNSFQDKIEELLEEKIIIPEKNKMSCSAGIIDSREHEFHPNVADILIKEVHDNLKLAKTKGANTVVI
ncbi:diguanylate cyclase domain-containing protein [Spirochaeta cellobiosiphila]|uniref:diguanylate cyclase domain-containing protein n=1 Tax=Spirochaeta cellobiosiphila TaxID=504483 RepID=UPI00040BFEF6|nr:diguanylate cyclase [Spirochaeta cellobiosiphila]